MSYSPHHRCLCIQWANVTIVVIAFPFVLFIEHHLHTETGFVYKSGLKISNFGGN